MRKQQRRRPGGTLKGGNLLESLDHAFRGLIDCLRRERNFRIHVVFALLVLPGAVFLGLNLVEFLLLLFVVALVLVAELVNTALEKMLDLLAPGRSIKVREIKNIGAAFVLVAAIASLFCGFLLLGAHLPAEVSGTIEAVRRSPWYLTVLGMLLTVLAVIALKVRLRARSLFRGGMPSGHAAFSFAMMMAIFYTTASPLALLMTLPLASLVAQSRVRRGIHTWLEVLLGALLGMLLMTAVFQLIYRGA